MLVTGGVAALNHRLMSGTPSGVQAEPAVFFDLNLGQASVMMSLVTLVAWFGPAVYPREENITGTLCRVLHNRQATGLFN